MASFANRLTNTARRLLTKYGQPINVTRLSTTNFDPSTGTLTDTTNITYAGVGYPSNYSDYLLGRQAGQVDIGETLIMRGDILLILSSSTEPQVNDVFEVNTFKYTALSVKKITAQGTNIIYKIQLRQ